MRLKLMRLFGLLSILAWAAPGHAQPSLITYPKRVQPATMLTGDQSTCIAAAFAVALGSSENLLKVTVAVEERDRSRLCMVATERLSLPIADYVAAAEALPGEVFSEDGSSVNYVRRRKACVARNEFRDLRICLAGVAQLGAISSLEFSRDVLSDPLLLNEIWQQVTTHIPEVYGADRAAGNGRRHE